MSYYDNHDLIHEVPVSELKKKAAVCYDPLHAYRIKKIAFCKIIKVTKELAMHRIHDFREGQVYIGSCLLFVHHNMLVAQYTIMHVINID